MNESNQQYPEVVVTPAEADFVMRLSYEQMHFDRLQGNRPATNWLLGHGLATIDIAPFAIPVQESGRLLEMIELYDEPPAWVREPFVSPWNSRHGFLTRKAELERNRVAR